MNTTQPQPSEQQLCFVGVKMTPALDLALRETAAARGCSISSVMRDALARELAGVPSGGPRRPAAARNSQS